MEACKTEALQNYVVQFTKCRRSSVRMLMKGFSECRVEDDVTAVLHCVAMELI